MAPCSPDSLLNALNWRYATKIFDPAKKVSDADLEVLKQSLVLTPSSFGLQPFRFLMVTDPAVRAQLREASWGQAQVTDCSHLVVFLARKGLTEADVDHYLARINQVRGDQGDKLSLFFREAHQIAHPDQVVRVLVVAGIADIVPDVVQESRGLQHLPEERRQFVRGLEAFEERQRVLSNLARVRDHHSVVPGELLAGAALISAQA